MTVCSVGICERLVVFFAMICTMKRLFLASSGLEYIRQFVAGKPNDMKMLFIPTAGNLDENVWWIEKDRDVLTQMGFRMTQMDIAQASLNEMRTHLEQADIVYIAGGNTFYLLQQLRDSHFDELLTRYVENGGLYAGASAGALIAGRDIEPISSIDEPEKVTGLTSTKGLGFVDIVPIPHYDMASRSTAIDAILAYYADTFEMVPLTDDQALYVEDDTWAVVESKRSAHEHAWFDKNHDNM